MKLPKSINILGLTYKVQTASLINENIDQEGECNYRRQEITIKENIPDDRALETLMHEIVHAILGGLRLEKENDDEMIVQSLAVGLNQALGPYLKFE